MTSNEGIQASVYTRWHQLSVPLAFALAVGSFMLVVFNRGPIGLAAVLAVLGLLVPPLVAFKGFPTRNVVKVTPEGLEFSRRRPVAFAELSSWGTDDYLKLVRPGLPTLLVSAADLLAVKKASEARNGQIVVARLGDDVTVKRLQRQNGHIELLPENPDFQTIVVGADQDFALEGIAVGLIRPHALH